MPAGTCRSSVNVRPWGICPSDLCFFYIISRQEQKDVMGSDSGQSPKATAAEVFPTILLYVHLQFWIKAVMSRPCNVFLCDARSLQQLALNKHELFFVPRPVFSFTDAERRWTGSYCTHTPTSWTFCPWWGQSRRTKLQYNRGSCRLCDLAPQINVQDVAQLSDQGSVQVEMMDAHDVG